LKESNTYRAVGLFTAPGKIMEQIPPESICKHVKGKKVIEKANMALSMKKHA